MAAPKEEPPLAAKLRTAYEQLTGGRRADDGPDFFWKFENWGSRKY